MCSNKDQRRPESVKKQLTEIVDETLQQRGDQILLLDDFKTVLNHFALAPTSKKHIKRIIEEKIGGSQKLCDLTFNLVTAKLEGRNIMLFVSTEIDREYQSFMVEMISGAYEGAKRTLRWMLETMVWTCIFQSSFGRSSIEELINEAMKELKNHNLSENFNLKEEIEREWQITYAYFAGILYFKEIFRPPSIGDVLDKITMLKKTKVKEEIRKLYKNLSKHAHLTPESTYLTIKENNPMKPTSTLFGKFDEKLFDDTFNLAVNAFDAVFALSLCINASCFNYSTVEEYVQDIPEKSELKNLEDRLRDHNLTLNLTKEIQKLKL
jgi:hypothetical protein